MSGGFFIPVSKSTLHYYRRPDNILVYETEDTSVETVRAWYDHSFALLEQISKPDKRLYDLRKLKNISIFALRTAVKLKSHRKADLIFAAVLINNSRVSELVDTVLAIQPGGNFRLFSNEEEAIHWLNQKVPV